MCISVQYVCVGYAYRFLCAASEMINVFVNLDCACTKKEMAVVWIREEIWVKAEFSSEYGSLPPTFPGEELSAGTLLFVALSHPPKQKLILPARSPTGLLPNRNR